MLKRKLKCVILPGWKFTYFKSLSLIGLYPGETKSKIKILLENIDINPRVTENKQDIYIEKSKNPPNEVHPWCGFKWFFRTTRDVRLSNVSNLLKFSATLIVSRLIYCLQFFPILLDFDKFYLLERCPVESKNQTLYIDTWSSLGVF